MQRAKKTNCGVSTKRKAFPMAAYLFRLTEGSAEQTLRRLRIIGDEVFQDLEAASYKRLEFRIAPLPDVRGIQRRTVMGSIFKEISIGR